MNAAIEKATPIIGAAIDKAAPVLTSAVERTIGAVERIDPEASQREAYFKDTTNAAANGHVEGDIKTQVVSEETKSAGQP